MSETTINDEVEQWLKRFGLPRLYSLGRSIFDPIWAEKEHASRGSELLHVLRGTVEVKTPRYSVFGQEGDTIYTPRGMPHRDVFPPGSTFEVYLAQFDWEGEAELLRGFAPERLSAAPEPIKARIAADWRCLYQDFQRTGPIAAPVTSLRLLQIILTMCREAAVPRAQETPDHGRQRRLRIMTQAKRLIHERYASVLSLDDLAAALEISPYHLSHVFSAESGFTLSHYLTTVRMEKAAELLKAARNPVGQVARLVGYRDPQYFGKVFKGHFGVSPSQYRAPSAARR